MAKQEFVDLNRQYVKINDSFDNDIQYWGSTSQSVESIIEENNVVIILGDKGSGKTTELRQFHLKHEQDSIYIELRDIYLNSQSLKSKLEALFSQKYQSNHLYLLFDSIDECRIGSAKYQDAFEISLQKIITDLLNFPDILDRVKFIFTSRECDWQKILDKKLIQEKLTINKLKTNNIESVSNDTSGNNTKTEQNKITINIFKLQDLNNDQKKLIAKNYGINADFFTDDVIAQEYSNTPLDCSEFIRFKMKIRNSDYKIEEFLMYKLQRRYRELNENRSADQISIAKIEHLSKRLATAILFCKTISIQKKEKYSNLNDSYSNISITSLFPEEDTSLLNSFLDSTLFLSNGEGTVKFWDELSRDNLAHFWLKDRIANGKYQFVKDLIFQRYNNIISPKKKFIVPIVFLVNTEPEFRKYLIEFNPEVLITYSYCCETLTEFDKKNILDNLFDKYAYRIRNITSNFFSNNEKSFNSFANNFDIEFLVNKLKEFNQKDFWEQYFLLKILYYSDIKNINTKLRRKVNEKLFSYVNNKTIRDLSYKAIEILLKQNDSKINIRLKNFLLKNITKLSEVMIGILLEYLYTQNIEFVEAITLIKQYIAVGVDKKFFYLRNIYKVIIQKESNPDVIKIVLNDFDFSKPESLALYISLFIQMIDCHGEMEDITEYLLELQVYIIKKQGQINDGYKTKDEFVQLKNKILPEINLSFARKLIEKYKTLKDNEYLFLFWQYSNLINIDIDVIKLLLEETNDSSLTAAKQLQIFRDCLNYLRQLDPNNCAKIIQPYLNTEEKSQVWDSFINPPVFEWQSKNEKNEKERKEQNEKDKKFLMEHLNDIKNAEKKYQSVLINLSLENGMNSSPEISNIELSWGKDVAEAYKLGIQTYWQICELDFKEYENKVIGTNIILNQTIAALTGLHIFFKGNPNVVINEEHAKRVIYWGIQDLNSIPDWTVKTIQQYPQVAKELILPIIDKIIKFNTMETSFLSKISRINSKVLVIFYEDLWWYIKNNKNSNVVKDIVKIIVNMDLNEDRIKELLKYISSQIIDIKNNEIYFWLRLLYMVSLEKFIQTIFELHNKYKNESESIKSFFIQFFGSLTDSIRYESKNRDKDNKKLIDLLPLLVKYINPNDDVAHVGAYTPNTRDCAQDFRDEIFNYITIKNFTLNDREYLLCLSKKIKNKIYCDRIKYIADELLLEDNTIFTENDVVGIENSDYMPPKNADDLFKIVCDKLYEIKMDIETSDYSLKKLYQDLATSKRNMKIRKEEHFQKYILMELRRLSRNLYSLVREPEVANNKKPDLQIWDKNWCVNIECKIADNWSGNEIYNTIEAQLIKKYLRYPKYQHGILLLARINKNIWKLENTNLSFSDLIKCVQEKANNIFKNKYNNIKAIKVIGIDYFTKENSNF